MSEKLFMRNNSNFFSFPFPHFLWSQTHSWELDT